MAQFSFYSSHTLLALRKSSRKVSISNISLGSKTSFRSENTYCVLVFLHREHHYFLIHLLVYISLLRITEDYKEQLMFALKSLDLSSVRVQQMIRVAGKSTVYRPHTPCSLPSPQPKLQDTKEVGNLWLSNSILNLLVSLITPLGLH